MFGILGGKGRPLMVLGNYCTAKQQNSKTAKQQNSEDRDLLLGNRCRTKERV